MSRYDLLRGSDKRSRDDRERLYDTTHRVQHLKPDKRQTRADQAGNPTPFFVNSRELELSLNEDYRTVDCERKDLVTCTTVPLDKDTEITGPMTATLWAATEGKDTD